MKKSKLTLLCILLVMSIVFASVFLVSCKDKNDENDNQDPDKKEAFITAGIIQEYIYDGNVHNVQAKLNHDEATLSYSPQQGYTDIGEYDITVSAPPPQLLSLHLYPMVLTVCKHSLKPILDSILRNL